MRLAQCLKDDIIASVTKRRIKETKKAFKLLLIASVVTVILWFVPYAEYVVYPIRIFVTILHEGAHALAALVTGGRVEYIQIKPDGSGLTATRGGLAVVISSAGYVGTMLYGALLLVLCKRATSASVALGGTAAMIGVASLALIRPIVSFGFAAGVILALILASLFYFSPPRLAQLFLGFLAVQSCLNALFDLKLLLFLSAEGSARTDALNLQEMTFIPAILWAVLWALMSIAILFLALRRYRGALG